MVLTKVLKRRDASSVVVAIVLGMALLQFVQTLTNKWAIKLTNVNYGPMTYHWKEDLLLPIVWFLLVIIALEVLGWVYIWASSAFKNNPR